MPDIYRYIKKRKQPKKWHKMELYGLNCGFSGLIYNTIFFIAKKCKFSKIRKQKQKKKQKSRIFPPLQLPTDTDWLTATLEKKNKKRFVKRKELLKVNLHWIVSRKENDCRSLRVNTFNEVAHLAHALFLISDVTAGILPFEIHLLW